MKYITFFALSALLVMFAVTTVRGRDYENWARQFGTASTDKALAVSTDGSGVYVVGKTLGTLSGQTSAGGNDAFIRKYDSAGEVTWTRQFGTPSSDLASGVAVYSSGIYVTGQFGNNAFVRKFDLEGNGFVDSAVWLRVPQYDRREDGRVRRLHWRLCCRVRRRSPARPDFSRRYRCFRAKVRLGRQWIWMRQFGSSAINLATGISVSSTGVYVCGVTEGLLRPVFGSYDGFVRRYDFDGTEIWTDQFGGTSFDWAQAIAADPSGIYVTGGFEHGSRQGLPSPGLVRKYDSDGAAVWQRDFYAYPTREGTGEFPWSVTIGEGISVDSSGLYIAGWALRPGWLGGPESPGDDAFVIKFDADGNRLWTRFVATPDHHDRANGIAVGPLLHDVFLAGVTGGTLGCLPVTRSDGGFDAFLVNVTEGYFSGSFTLFQSRSRPAK